MSPDNSTTPAFSKEEAGASVSEEPEFPLINRYQAAWGEQAARTGQRLTLLQVYLVACATLFGFWITHAHTPESDPSSALNQAQKALIMAEGALANNGSTSTKNHSVAMTQRFNNDETLKEIREAKKVLENAARTKSENTANVLHNLLAWGITLLTVACSLLVLHVNAVIRKLTEFMKNCEFAAAKTIQNQGKAQRGVEIDLFRFCDGETAFNGRPAEVAGFHSRHRLLNRAIFVAIFSTTDCCAIIMSSKYGTVTYREWCWLLMAASMVIIVFDDIWDFVCWVIVRLKTTQLANPAPENPTPQDRSAA